MRVISDMGTIRTVVLTGSPITRDGRLNLVTPPLEPKSTSRPEPGSKATTVCDDGPMTSPVVSVCIIDWPSGSMMTSELLPILPRRLLIADNIMGAPS